MQFLFIPFFLNIPNLNLHLTSFLFPTQTVPSQIINHKAQFLTQKPPIDFNAALDFLNSGISKAIKKDAKGAITDFTKSIKIYPSERAYYFRAEEKMNLKDWQGAIADFNEVIKLNPQLADSFYGRGQVKSILGNKKGAIADFNQVIKLNSDVSGAYYERGKIKAELGNLQGAIKDFNQAIKLDPTSVRAYQSRGNLKTTLGDRQGSILDFNKASQSDALNYIGAVNRYSQAYMIDKNMVATNLEMLQVEIKPQTDSYAYNFQRIDLNTTQFTAVSKQNNLKTYIGFTVLKNKATSMAIVCETNQINNISTLVPQIINSKLICPQGTNPAKL